MMDPTTLLLVLMIGAAPSPSLGGSTASSPRIDQRQAAQQQRIHQGIASGELTRKEAARLQKEQARIQRAEDKALADGRLTRYERAQIERMQDKASAHIAAEKHDRQHAYRR